ncbi:MAG: hypothetical protein A2Y76_14645 [Planctomycetes bacterium RBG_13_60_9]|nr:MAG: hypothetical protein A2Y76_14645 [Planctomycetes bacterium RBG_13_60_9]
MNANQRKKIEETIDGLCENLVWAWAYFRTLAGLHEVAKTSKESLDAYPQLISCVYHGLFDALFLRLHHFIDGSRNAGGFPSLFKILRRYCPVDTDLMRQIEEDERRLREEASAQKINNWRNQVVAHFTSARNDPDFFSDNRLRLSEISGLIVLLENCLEGYSMKLLQRENDTRYPSDEVINEVSRLLKQR